MAPGLWSLTCDITLDAQLTFTSLGVGGGVDFLAFLLRAQAPAKFLCNADPRSLETTHTLMNQIIRNIYVHLLPTGIKS